MKRYAAENKDLRVYDAETGEMLHGIQWFDDETLEYEQSVHFMTADRTTVFYFNDPDNPERLLSEIKQGGIVVREAPAQDDEIKVTPAEIVERAK